MGLFYNYEQSNVVHYDECLRPENKYNGLDKEHH